MNRKEYVKTILPCVGAPRHREVEVFSPINIALIKYWGKRDEELMLPYNSSLSVTLNNLGTKTKLAVAKKDTLIVNGMTIDTIDKKFTKVFDYLHLLCGEEHHFLVETENNIPIASGLASSASSFSSFAKAVDSLFELNLTKENLARIARMGSVSAGRSLLEGFVLMDHREDCGITTVQSSLEDFCMGFCMVSEEEKKHKSRDNMEFTVEHSVFYEAWLYMVNRDLDEIIPCIQRGEFYRVGTIAERNALCMHASIAMLSEEDRVYLKKESLELIARAQHLRKEGLAVFCTMDAGPNVKLIFQGRDLASVKTAFPEMKFMEKIC